MRIRKPYTAAPYVMTASHEAKFPHCPVSSGTITNRAITTSHLLGRIILSTALSVFCNTEALYAKLTTIAIKAAHAP